MSTDSTGDTKVSVLVWIGDPGLICCRRDKGAVSVIRSMSQQLVILPTAVGNVSATESEEGRPISASWCRSNFPGEAESD